MRKWMSILRWLSGGALVVAILLLAQNRGAEDLREMRPVRFSRESGFYDEEFWLEMQCDGAEIHYTLDSTPPDANSPLYTGPILIRDASPDPNHYSQITDVCIELKPELLADVGMSPKFGFTTPTEPVDKATVVRAVSVDAFGNASEIVNAVYFVGFDQKTAYDGINVVSITTDPDNLFDYEDGIYVLGKTFGDTLVDGHVVEPVSPNLGNWFANYKNKGIAWEREASICFFDADRRLVLSGNYGIRVQGGASRFMLPKSLNLYARRRYGSEFIPAADLFGEDWRLHSVNLNAGGQGVATKLHDWLINSLVSDMNVLTREYEPYALFLDGEFWGLYWLTPRFKEDYFENKYGIFGSNIIETKVDYIEVGDDDDFKYYKTLLQLIGDSDLRDPELYERVCQQVDMDSWIDYYAIELYIANSDWPKNNKSVWKTRWTTDRPNEDGKWRWILFDVNLAMDLEDARDDYVKRTASRDAIFASLISNADFRSRLYDKLVELAENQLHPDRVEALVRDYEQRMGGVMAKEYSRFINTRTEQDFIQSCEDMIGFFRERHDYIMEVYGEKQE